MAGASSDEALATGHQPGQVGLAIYALITTAVVLAGVDENDPFEIAAVIVGQALALLVAHAYAESVAHRMTLWEGLKHALPILVVAAPTVLVGLLFGILELEGEAMVYTAEAANLVGLVALQGIATGRGGFTWARVGSALLVDIVAILTVVAIVALLK